MAKRAFRFQYLVSTLPHDFPIKESGRKSSLSAGKAWPFAGCSLAERGMTWLVFLGNSSPPQAQQGEIRTVCFIFKFPCVLGYQPDPLFFKYSCLWFNFLWVYFFFFFFSIIIPAKNSASHWNGIRVTRCSRNAP